MFFRTTGKKKMLSLKKKSGSAPTADTAPAVTDNTQRTDGNLAGPDSAPADVNVAGPTDKSPRLSAASAVAAVTEATAKVAKSSRAATAAAAAAAATFAPASASQFPNRQSLSTSNVPNDDNDIELTNAAMSLKETERKIVEYEKQLQSIVSKILIFTFLLLSLPMNIEL